MREFRATLWSVSVACLTIASPAARLQRLEVLRVRKELQQKDVLDISVHGGWIGRLTSDLITCPGEFAAQHLRPIAAGTSRNRLEAHLS